MIGGSWPTLTLSTPEQSRKRRLLGVTRIRQLNLGRQSIRGVTKASQLPTVKGSRYSPGYDPLTLGRCLILV